MGAKPMTNLTRFTEFLWLCSFFLVLFGWG